MARLDPDFVESIIIEEDIHALNFIAKFIYRGNQYTLLRARIDALFAVKGRYLLKNVGRVSQLVLDHSRRVMSF
jgi:hypothetical protein